MEANVLPSRCIEPYRDVSIAAVSSPLESTIFLGGRIEEQEERGAALTLELVSDVDGQSSAEDGDVVEGGLGEGEANVVDDAEARVRAGVGNKVNGLEHRPDHVEHSARWPHPPTPPATPSTTLTLIANHFSNPFPSSLTVFRALHFLNLSASCMHQHQPRRRVCVTDMWGPPSFIYISKTKIP
uniref:Uncharacterized protein n=1 Tax=Oryza meridionalis TaxID=40149 RepID=A0A0E0DX14_9ORYZ